MVLTWTPFKETFLICARFPPQKKILLKTYSVSKWNSPSYAKELDTSQSAGEGLPVERDQSAPVFLGATPWSQKRHTQVPGFSVFGLNREHRTK